MDIFDTKDIKPMLIGEVSEAFDSTDHIFEIKLDGERCLAYLDSNSTELRNKRNMKMLLKVPELSQIHKQVKYRCILDGELIITKEGKPDFFEIQRRSLMSNAFKIKLAASKFPASFTAFDILYMDDHQVMELPLLQRKSLLENIVMENSRIAISRYIQEKGVEFYRLAKENNLEGIVAKEKSSRYYPDRRTKDWIKIKNLQDDDFAVCGYILKENGVVSIVLGQFLRGDLVYKGHVTLGASTSDFNLIKSLKTSHCHFKEMPPAHENALWVAPKLVCTVKYMMKTSGGGLRQPVFKGMREDKEPFECVASE